MAKPASQSATIMTEMVLPNDTNTLGNLMGGRLLYLMDIAGAVAAQKHAGSTVVTASVDNVSFAEAIGLGNIITLKSQVTRAFTSSMEVYIEVWAEDIPAGKRVSTNSAYLTFVAVDQHRRPIEVPSVIPETDQERARYDSALRRRQLRLVLAGRMKPTEATELRALLLGDIDKA